MSHDIRRYIVIFFLIHNLLVPSTSLAKNSLDMKTCQPKGWAAWAEEKLNPNLYWQEQIQEMNRLKKFMYNDIQKMASNPAYLRHNVMEWYREDGEGAVVVTEVDILQTGRLLLKLNIKAYREYEKKVEICTEYAQKMLQR